MDTPSSTVTSTASNTSQLTNSRKTGSQLQDRFALIDISNDSPVVGLESGNLMTPSSGISRMRNGNRYLEMKTPGSGESILRGQVKTLLQKVEEEAEITKKGLFSPCLLNQECFEYVCYDSVVQENDKISQLVSEMMSYGKKQGGSLISELSADKSEEGKNDDSTLTEDDNSSVWSIQVNAGSVDEKEEDEEEEDEMGKVEEEEVDELCEVMKNMDVVGRHTRFVYDSEDELVKEELVKDEKEGVLKLKGLPTPQGKHMRFPHEEE